MKTWRAAKPLFSAAMLIYAVFFTECVLFGGLHLAAALLFFVFGVASSVCFLRKKTNDLPFSIACGVLAAVGTLTFLLNNNSLISVLLLFFLGALYVAWASAFAPRVQENRGSWEYLAGLARLGILQPFVYWPDAWRMLLRPFKQSKSRRTRDVLVGLLIAVPVCGVAIGLLASGDSAFSQLLSAVWERIANVDLTLPAKCVLVALFWPLFAGFVLGVRRAPKKQAAPSDAGSVAAGSAKCRRGVRFLSPTVSVTVLGALSFVYLVYLFSQLSYFFSAFARLLPEGYAFSYAEYARRGFFEMCLLTVINFSLLCAALLFTKRTKQKVSPVLKAVACAVCVFTLLFIVTSLSKILLYVSSYGLTTLRLYTAVFDCMLLICTVCLGVHLFLPKWKYMRVILISVSAIFIVFALADADRIIAGYNTERYLSSTGEAAQIDMEYLATLDSAAVPYLEKIYLDDTVHTTQFDRQRNRVSALNTMAQWRDKLCTPRVENGRVVGYDYKYSTSPTSFCLSDFLAVKVLDRNVDAVETWCNGTQTDAAGETFSAADAGEAYV